MKKWYRVQENGVNLVFLVTEKGEVFFVHCQKSGFEEKEIPEDQLEGYRLVQLQAAGEDQDDHHGAKYIPSWMKGRKMAGGSPLPKRIL